MICDSIDVIVDSNDVLVDNVDIIFAGINDRVWDTVRAVPGESKHAKFFHDFFMIVSHVNIQSSNDPSTERTFLLHCNILSKSITSWGPGL